MLRNSEVRIRTVFQTIPLGIIIASGTGIIESASPACLELFKCTYADLHQRNLQDLFLSEGSLIDHLSGLGTDAKEFTAIRRDCTQFPASLKACQLAGVTVPGMLVVVEDVTAKHELERMKEEFLSMMTHDLRAPVASVKTFLELIAENIYDDKQDELKRRSRSIANDVGRLINMISSLLDLHKLEAGRLQLCEEAVAVNSIVLESTESLMSLSERRGVPLNVLPASQDLLVMADKNYTIQVLVNLLSNALKFSPKGSPVTISLEPSEEFVKVTVSDKGRGIPKDFQNRLFNRFEQVQLSDARALGGSGLGLAFSKSIIEQQGGRIGVESEPGQGCDFWFTLRRVSA